eukprot:gb/GECG01008659.1/.p1 GENE.gb/GECG01008659.1/~~gb/GECG01008659.1/.p1  ORF type:complete len:174 (+),score=21.60 gb/GECG01008659.1/:1-522(+)
MWYPKKLVLSTKKNGVVVAPPGSNVTSSKILDERENGITPLVLTLGFMNDAHDRASLQKQTFKELLQSLPPELSNFLTDIVPREPELLKTFWRLHSQYSRADSRSLQRFGEMATRIAEMSKSVAGIIKSIEENTDTESKRKMLQILDPMSEQLNSAVAAYCSKTGSKKEHLLP